MGNTIKEFYIADENGNDVLVEYEAYSYQTKWGDWVDDIDTVTTSEPVSDRLLSQIEQRIMETERERCSDRAAAAREDAAIDAYENPIYN